MTTRLPLLFALLVNPALAAVAQDEAPPQQAYDQAATNYTDVFAEIEQLRGEYQAADPARRKEIDAELPAIVDRARDRMGAWTDAALALYQAKPNENNEVSELLAGMAKHFAVGEAPPKATGGRFFGGDQYEKAMPLIDALIEGGYPDKNLYVWGGYSAVCLNEYDKAEKYFTMAQEKGALASPPADEAGQQFYQTAQSWFANLGEMRANWEAEKKIREAEAQKDDLPRVKFTTSKGDIVLELFEDQAPIATANMITLVKSGFYNNVVFHRVLPHFMAQGGDPQGTGQGGPGYNIESQFSGPDARKHFRGSISMANTGRPNTGGSQFFLCFVPTDFLNGRHTCFGRVVEGIEVLGKLERIDPSAQGPYPKADKIISAEVVRDRGSDYASMFEKLPE